MVQYISKSQTNSSLAERERFFKGLRLPQNTPHIFLQTCDRIELYWGEGFVPEEIAYHLFSVVSGLDSSLIGESAIQGQVKNCYQQSAEKYKLSGSLHKLFQTALSVGKRVRTESAISQGAISHSQAVIETLIHEQIPLKNARITILGINKLNEDIIKFLKAKGAVSIFLGNRYFEKAELMAEKYDCQAFRFDQIKSFMEFTDVLITATSAPHIIVRPEHVSAEQKIVMLDLAFPRDVDPVVGKMDNVTLFNLEDMKQRVDQNLASRKQRVKFALEIIDQEVEKFVSKTNGAVIKLVSTHA